MIQAEDLSKQFDQFWAVDGVNLDVPQGHVLVLLGPNGAGKTTTVRMLTSILSPTRGKASVAGYDVVQEADRVRASVGVLTEHHGLYTRMNAEEYLRFFGKLYLMDSTLIRQRTDLLLEEFGLDSARTLRLGKYSKGMRQKLSLARTLLHDPPVLLLDEPTSAMDPESARIVRDALQQLRSSQRTILLCTHNLMEAEILADQIAIIRHGKIILQGSPVEVKRMLLGPAEYQVTFASELNGYVPTLQPGIQLISKSPRSFRFAVEEPERQNPAMLREMLNSGLEVISFQEVSRSLEDAYLEAVSRYNREEADA